MEKVWRERLEEIKRFFEDDFFEYFLEDNDILQGISFFGSQMKGKAHADSDLDIILIPTSSFLEETQGDDMDRIQTLLRLHDALVEGLVKPIPLDVKLQEFQNEDEQYGWTYRTGNTIATFYSFIKGEIGELAFINQKQDCSFLQI